MAGAGVKVKAVAVPPVVKAVVSCTCRSVARIGLAAAVGAVNAVMLVMSVLAPAVAGRDAERVKAIHFQLPEPSERMIATSPAAVVILAAPGRIRLVALWVRVKAPEKVSTFLMPAVSVPNPVIVVVPVTVISPSLTVDKSVVVAEAIVPSPANAALTTD